MTYLRTSSSTTVRLNGDLTRRDLFPVRAASTAIAEGLAITIGADGRAALADATSTFMLVNYVASSRADVAGYQTDPISGASITLETGGMTGILCNNTMIGLPVDPTYFVTTPTAADVGKFVVIGAGGKFDFYSATADQLDFPGALDTYLFGTAVKLEGRVFWLCLKSTPWAVSSVDDQTPTGFAVWDFTVKGGGLGWP